MTVNCSSINTTTAGNENRLENHPCYNEKSRHTYARIHLPVAPRCNVQCRFCNRKYSCVNESRPGVTAKVMTPAQAFEHLQKSMEIIPNISVVGIAGPGDPFANPEETLNTFRLVRKQFPDIMLCVSSNGLNILPYVDDLKKLRVSHVTITVNAVEPAIGAQIYEWIKTNKYVFKGTKAAYYLWDYQQLAIQALTFRKILVKVNTVYIPGINSFHIEHISKTVASLGASLHNIIPLIPTSGTAFEKTPEPNSDEIRKARESSKQHLPQMEHCSRCRADAVGLLGNSSCAGKNQKPVEFIAKSNASPDQNNSENEQFSKKRPYVAVASREGLYVNLHLGEADSLRIYKPGSRKPVLIDIRCIYSNIAQCGNSRWHDIAALLKDCSYLLVSGIGPVPRSILSSKGINVKIVQDYIIDAFTNLSFSDSKSTEKPFQCGETCTGSGDRCSMEAQA